MCDTITTGGPSVPRLRSGATHDRELDHIYWQLASHLGHADDQVATDVVLHLKHLLPTFPALPQAVKQPLKPAGRGGSSGFIQVAE